MADARENSRKFEIDAYREAYKDPHYGMGVRRRAHVKAMLAKLERGSLLDVATGRGECLKFARELGFSEPIIGTEVVDDLLDVDVVFARAHDLPFEDGSFDVVTCFDVLEHLIEDDIRPCLREMYRVARRTCIVSASERPGKWRGGRDLHISRRPAAEWAELIADCWPGMVGFGSAGASPCFRVDKA